MIAPPGLAGVVVAETTVGDLRGDAGFCHYREYDAVALARSRSFEDVWRLLLDGALPGPAEREAFAAEVRAVRVLLAVPLPLDGSATAAVRSVLSVIGAVEAFRPIIDLDVPARRRDCIRMAAVLPSAVAAVHRRQRGLELVAPRDDLGHAANLLWMLTGDVPDPDVAAVLERYLVIALDHGFNTSTFTARVIASSGADVAAAVVGAIGALSGPRHGGAPSRVLDLLDTVNDPVASVDALLARGERMPGFGHRIYHRDDPRAVFLREVAEVAGAPRYEVARAVELAAAERLGPRGLAVNVEFYAGVVLDHCGIPRDLFTSVFAASRVVGWCAHILEQAVDPRIIRPSARYVGPPAPQPVPEV